MTLRPLQDWAVIRKSEPKERTAGGIIIPEVAKEEPLEGVIVAIGPGKFVAEKGKEKEEEEEEDVRPDGPETGTAYNVSEVCRKGD
jgi:chaperonin GroES